MDKDKKVKINKLVIAKKNKNQTMESRGEGVVGGFIEKAWNILDKLELWQKVIQDEAFVDALAKSIEDKQDNLDSLGAALIESFLSKDFKKTQSTYFQITATGVKTHKTTSNLIQEILKPLVISVWNNMNCKSFCSILSASICVVIDKANDDDSKDHFQLDSSNVSLIVEGATRNIGNSGSSG